MDRIATTIARGIVCAVTVLCCANALSGVEFAGGTGEPNDPYQIATAEQLIGINSDPNLLDKCFLLVNDIDLDPNLPGGKVFSGALIAPHPGYSIEEAAAFRGTLDGSDHAIYNLSIDVSSTSYRAGLFGFIGRTGRVKALRLEGVDVHGCYRVGALAGENWGVITECHITGVIQGREYVGGLVGSNGSLRTGREGPDRPRYALPLPDSVEGLIYACSVDVEVGAMTSRQSQSYYLGGLVGRNSGGLIYACRAAGTVTGTRYVGGLIGANSSGWIRSSYAWNRVHAGRYAGGLAGSDSYGSILFSYAAGPVSADAEAGAGGISASYVSSAYLCYWDMHSSGCASGQGGRAKTTEQMMTRETFRGWGYDGQWVLADGRDYPRLIWEGTLGEPLADDPVPFEMGEGTVEDPYQIATSEQFLALGYGWPWFDRHFVLVADVDVSAVDANNMAPIGTLAIPFSGVFDGNHHTISGFRLSSPHENHVGMFGRIGVEGVVKNVAVLASEVQGLTDVGILAGYNNGAILTCHTEGRVCGDTGVGGMLAVNDVNGTAVSCTSNAELVGNESVGGLVSRNYGSINASCSLGVVTAFGGAAGGFVNTNVGVILSSCTYATVRGSYVGGFAEWNGVGILAGRTQIGEVLDCYCVGVVEEAQSAGGFIDSNSGIIRRCYSASQVHSVGKARGFAVSHDSSDYYESLIEDCYWDVQTSGIATSAAGEGRTSEQMRQQATFSGWDFENTWTICEGQDYPRLQWEGVECEDGL
jgi:hypothetical protein